MAIGSRTRGSAAANSTRNPFITRIDFKEASADLAADSETG
jgi:hypothetical protein